MMKRKTTDIAAGCAGWREQISGLLELAPGEDVRMAWERHARECVDCSAVLAEERQMRELMHCLTDPGPAYVSGRVMSHVKRGTAPGFKFRLRDAALGLAGSFAGIALGFWLAGTTVETSPALEPVAAYELTLSGMDGGLDDLLEVVAAVDEEVP